jgi:hypothetical protein
MAPDVADAWWWCLHRLHGQPPVQLTSVGRRSSGSEIQASTAIGSR